MTAKKSPLLPSRSWPFWLGVILAVLVFLYLVKGVLMPFVVGIMVAYFLDPVADWLQRHRFSRGISTLIITVLFFAILALLIALAAPFVADQLQILLTSLPQAITEQQQKLEPVVNGWLHRIDPALYATLSEQLKDASKAVLSESVGFVRGVMESGLAAINLLSLLFITPVVTFYFLRDWDVMVKKIHDLLPRRHEKTIKAQMDKINQTLSGYLRGQTNVCLLLGTFYAVGLTLVGLNGGALIGFITGIATFIPYVGMILGTVIGLSVAYLQFGDMQGVLIVAGVFAFGQIIEGNFVAPKLVGDKVHLHPVWLIFGMLAGGALFGFLGVLLAVPVTAVIGVLARFFVGEYQKSRYYKA